MHAQKTYESGEEKESSKENGEQNTPPSCHGHRSKENQVYPLDIQANACQPAVMKTVLVQQLQAAAAAALMLSCKAADEAGNFTIRHGWATAAVAPLTSKQTSPIAFIPSQLRQNTRRQTTASAMCALWCDDVVAPQHENLAGQASEHRCSPL